MLCVLPVVGAFKYTDEAVNIVKGAKKAANTVETSIKVLKGEIHHPFSAQVVRALENHPTLKGIFQYRDPRYVTQAVDKVSHEGYGKVFRNLDEEVSQWIRHPDNQTATPDQFLSWLRSRYNQPDLKSIFPKRF